MFASDPGKEFRNRRGAGRTIFKDARSYSSSAPSTLPAMNTIVEVAPVAAVGYSILYMIFGGGLLGAVVIFIIAKMFGK